MSERFYDKVLSLFFGFSFFLVLMIANAELLFLYISQQSPLFYYAWLGFLVVAALYGIKYYRNFQDFKGNLSLFVPNEANSELNPDSLNLETDDNALKVCLWYQQGARFEDIQKNLGLKHPQQIKRELIKGLTFLLKFYSEHKEKEVKT